MDLHPAGRRGRPLTLRDNDDRSVPETSGASHSVAETLGLQSVDDDSVRAQAREIAAPMAAALDAMPQPVFVLGGDGSMLYSNHPAIPLLRDGVLGIKDGRITNIGGDPRPWALALRQVGKGVGCVLPLTAIGRKGACTGLVRMAPVSGSANFALAWRSAIAVAVFELRTEADNLAALALIESRYGLTPTEAAVLKLLATGGRIRSIAERLNVKVSTARTHLRNLFDKTGLRRQADLARLLAR